MSDPFFYRPDLHILMNQAILQNIQVYSRYYRVERKSSILRGAELVQVVRRSFVEPCVNYLNRVYVL